jgi:hypothetical protein
MSFVPRQIPTILASFFRLSGIRPNSCKISSEKNTVTTIHSPPFDPELMPPKVVQRNVATQLRKFFNMQNASLHSYFCACASPTVYDEHALFDAEFREILFRKLIEADACAIGACVDQGLNGMARQDRDILQLSFLEALAFQGCHESDLVLMGNNESERKQVLVSWNKFISSLDDLFEFAEKLTSLPVGNSYLRAATPDILRASLSSPQSLRF